jgi:hypothetical protein
MAARQGIYSPQLTPIRPNEPSNGRTNRYGVGLQDPGYENLTPITYKAQLSTTEALMIPPDNRIRKYEIQNLDATNGVHYNKSGGIAASGGGSSFIPAVTGSNSLGSSIRSEETPCNTGVHMVAAAGTPIVNITLWIF